MNPRTCQYEPCDESLTGRHANVRYCSPEHKSAAYSERKLQERHERIGARKCDQCDTPIEEQKHPRTRFCSGRCRLQWANDHHTEKRTARRKAARAGRTCAACPNVIPAELRASAIYCSDACKHRVNVATWRAKATGYNRQYLYGITPEQWDTQLAAQDYRCIVCRSGEWLGKANSPHADHDHTLPTFVLRGIPCNNCNNGLGRFGDDPLRLIAAARYLLTAKASESGAGVPCDDLAVLGGALRALAGDDPGLLGAAAGFVEAAPVLV